MMKRIGGVVLAFVVANTVGFVAYRELSTSEAAPAPPSSSAATLAREPAPIQPKPTPPQPTLPDEKTIVSPPTPPPPVEEQAPHPLPVPAERPRPISKSIPPKRVEKTTPPPAPSVKPAAETKPVAEPKPAEKDHLLDMDSNPYKRGE